jgi:hypothetical protein
MANGMIDGWIGRRRQGNKSPPPAAYVHLRIYTEGCAHTVLYAYVRRTPRSTYNSFTWNGSKVNWDFKESETWPGGPDRPSLVNVVLYFDY